MSLNGYSLLHGPEMTYEELIQMEEQIGNVPKGLTELQIRQIPLMPYRPKDSNPEMYLFYDSAAVYASTNWYKTN